jgi:hypothetical protein
MSTLVSALIDIAIRIGKAIIRNLARWTLKRLLRWMWKRVGVFKERWERARIEGNERRQRWLLGRIERWSRAANWLEERALETLREAAKQACQLPAFQKLPPQASCELLSSY